MHLYSTINEPELERIASSMGIQLYQFDTEPPARSGKYAGRNRYRFLLRPVTDEYRLVREDAYTRSGYRRVWAVSWRGHRDFMRAVYAIDPSATFKTAIDTWRDSADFEERHEAGGNRNIGPMMAPQAYRDAELAA